tara:strand:- start:280 stop:423 length:144 start_codon:yes stop_codon:yes gene_type:complete
MSFGGGGGSSGVSAHVHSNAAGEGGSLKTQDSLIDDTNLYGRILVSA